MRTRISNICLLLAVPAVPSALAPYCASWHWILDLLACFPVHAMGWLCLCAAVLFASGSLRGGLACLLLAAVAAYAVVPGWLAATPCPETGTPVRVLSLNLLYNNVQVEAAREEVARTKPDVVWCSEVTPAWLAGLLPALEDFPHRCTQAEAGAYGVALFSRWPLREAAVIPVGYQWAPAIRAIVEAPAGPIGLLGVHVPRPGSRLRCEQRNVALAALPAAVAALPAPRIVIGDLNATPWNPAFRAMVEASRLVPLSTFDWRPTWPSTTPWPLRIPIDHVLASSDVGLEHAEVGRSFGSDHLPLFAVLRVARPVTSGR
ncbi:MAG TPA: endonuclease/exonuclease/phosphatase family protein [Planctomycetota bacterium]